MILNHKKKSIVLITEGFADIKIQVGINSDFRTFRNNNIPFLNNMSGESYLKVTKIKKVVTKPIFKKHSSLLLKDSKILNFLNQDLGNRIEDYFLYDFSIFITQLKKYRNDASMKHHIHLNGIDFIKYLKNRYYVVEIDKKTCLVNIPTINITINKSFQ